jgi:hypothetical protein
VYAGLLFVHSWLRWVVLILGALAAAQALAGWLGGRRWTPADDRAGLLFSIALDAQFLAGLALYVFLSPISRAALQSGSAAMQNAQLRFWGYEHPAMMLLALIFVHVGRVLVRKAADARVRHRRAALHFTAATILMIAGTPWPGSANARALFRLTP